MEQLSFELVQLETLETQLTDLSNQGLNAKQVSDEILEIKDVITETIKQAERSPRVGMAICRLQFALRELRWNNKKNVVAVLLNACEEVKQSIQNVRAEQNDMVWIGNDLYNTVNDTDRVIAKYNKEGCLYISKSIDADSIETICPSGSGFISDAKRKALDLAIADKKAADKAAQVDSEFDQLLDNLNDYQQRVEGYVSRKNGVAVDIFQVACNTGLAESQVWEAVAISERLIVNGQYLTISEEKTETKPSQQDAVSSSKSASKLKSLLVNTLACIGLSMGSVTAVEAAEWMAFGGALGNGAFKGVAELSYSRNGQRQIYITGFDDCRVYPDNTGVTVFKVNQKPVQFTSYCDGDNKVFYPATQAGLDYTIGQFKKWNWVTIADLDFSAKGFTQALNNMPMYAL